MKREYSGFMLKTVESLIDALGGTSAVATLAGVGLPAVSNWKTRGCIPPERFMLFSEEAAKLNKRVDPALFGFDTAGARS